MQILAIGIHKGGTSKSTTAFNLGHELAARGKRVLLVDCDYQGSLSSMAGCESVAGRNMTQVMTGKLPLRNVITVIRPTLHLAPADIELAHAELEISSKIGRENILRRALVPVGADYALAILDCPPALGVMTVNALATAHAVLIPLTPTSTDMRALDLFLATVADVRNQLNPGLQLLGVVLTFFDPRYGLHGDVIRALQDANLPIVGTIGRSVKVAEATGAHLPISEYDVSNPQAQAFKVLSGEIDQWLNDQM
jgi:chromosome partitioning protein